MRISEGRSRSRQARIAFLLFLALMGPAAAAKSPADADTTALRPHPRIFLTPAFLAELKGRANNRNNDWPALKSKADSYLHMDVPPFARSGGTGITYTYQGGGWLDAIEHLGLMYQITGDARYARKVIEILNVINDVTKSGSVEPLSLDAGYPSRTVALGAALAYDWTFDQLTPEIKADTYASINAWFDWYKKSAYQNTCSGYSNYFGGHVLGFGIAGLATAGENPRGQEIATYIRNVFDVQMRYAFGPEGTFQCSGYTEATGGFAGGYPVESFNYGPPHFERLLQYTWAVQTATGEDIGSDYAKRIARNLLYNLKPDRWRSTDEGNFPGDTAQIMPRGLPLSLTLFLQGTKEGQWMQYYYNHMVNPPGVTGAYFLPSPFFGFLYGDRMRPALDYRTTEPTYFLSPGDNHVYTRFDWTDNAVWASFAAGGKVFAGHEANKAGHISIQRGRDYLLVNSGQWKGLNGYSGNPQSFDLASWRSNTLFFNDLGDYLPTSEGAIGGQAGWGPSRIQSELTPDFVYAKSDLSDNYARSNDQRSPKRSLHSYQRTFVQIGGNKFVLIDRVSVAKPTYVKEVCFHLNPMDGKPTISGDVVRTKVGASALFIKTLLPAKPVIEVVGDPVSNTDAHRITYREQVADSNASTELLALHVLMATGSSIAEMPDTRLLASADASMEGAFMQEGNASFVVMFSSSGQAQKGISYTAVFAGEGAHLLTDLVPGAYQVCRDGAVLLAEQRASGQGVLFFRSPGGGVFSVVAPGQTCGGRPGV
jgi:hypothetical protein